MKIWFFLGMVGGILGVLSLMLLSFANVQLEEEITRFRILNLFVGCVVYTFLFIFLNKSYRKEEFIEVNNLIN